MLALSWGLLLGVFSLSEKACFRWSHAFLPVGMLALCCAFSGRGLLVSWRVEACP